jgi:hypothetical protein
VRDGFAISLKKVKSPRWRHRFLTFTELISTSVQNSNSKYFYQPHAYKNRAVLTEVSQLPWAPIKAHESFADSCYGGGGRLAHGLLGSLEALCVRVYASTLAALFLVVRYLAMTDERRRALDADGACPR